MKRKTDIIILVSFIAFVFMFCSSCFSAKSRIYQARIADGTRGDIIEQIKRILLWHNYSVARFENLQHHLLIETDWLYMDPTEEQAERDINQLRIRLQFISRQHRRRRVSRFWPTTTIGYVPMQSLQMTGEVEYVFRETDDWAESEMHPEMKEYFENIKNVLKRELHEITIRR